MSAEHDIVARATFQPGSSSVGALAAYVRASCGHVILDEHVIARGYRFYRAMSDEIPHFFNKRFSYGDTNLAVTLQAGFALEGEDRFADCTTHAEAAHEVQHNDGQPTIWSARVTIDMATLRVDEVAEPVRIARDPGLFRALADELVGAGILPGHACPLCGNAPHEHRQA